MGGTPTRPSQGPPGPSWDPPGPSQGPQEHPGIPQGHPGIPQGYPRGHRNILGSPRAIPGRDPPRDPSPSSP
ncbi:PREDICTED: proline-rich protein 2-like [Chaetura pelagica]|uniref:proline-rich protein 2-like n=1 Tax=Chaetura pelagica TaxID=8897 RepID=UPI00052336D2|nr:PREDICTED: proline-rich protein 2-like [Chaetura pelagica]